MIRKINVFKTCCHLCARVAALPTGLVTVISSFAVCESEKLDYICKIIFCEAVDLIY